MAIFYRDGEPLVREQGDAAVEGQAFQSTDLLSGEFPHALSIWIASILQQPAMSMCCIPSAPGYLTILQHPGPITKTEFVKNKGSSQDHH